MPRSIVALCALLGALLWAGPAQAARASQPAPAPGQLPLVAVRAGRGTLERVGGARFVLTLREVAREGDVGSDPLERDAAGIPLRTFFAGWRALGFHADAPDAVIVLDDGRRDADTLAVELGAPRYDARRRSLRIPVRALRVVSAGLERFGDDLDASVPARFDDVSLLIDDTVPVPTGGRGVCGNMGQLALFPRDTPRSDSYWAANGQLVPIQSFTALFALMGNRFGGDGKLAFALPKPTAPAGLRYEFCVSGWWPARGDDGYDMADCTTGAISLQAQTWRTGGWLPADGGSADPQRWRRLHEAIGTTFGGDGETTFRLPKIPELFALFGNAFGGDGVTTFALPRLPGPVAGTSYGICSEGIWPS